MDPRVERFQRERVLEVDVGDEGHRGVWDDVGECSRGPTVRNCDADDLAPCLRQFMNLTQSRDGIACIRGCHRLHDDRILTADFHFADLKHASGPPRGD